MESQKHNDVFVIDSWGAFPLHPGSIWVNYLPLVIAPRRYIISCSPYFYNTASRTIIPSIVEKEDDPQMGDDKLLRVKLSGKAKGVKGTSGPEEPGVNGKAEWE